MKVFNFKRFAKAISDYRKLKHVTLRHVHAKTGISTATISRAEIGLSKLDIDVIMTLCHYINSPITNFITTKASKNDKKNKAGSTNKGKAKGRS